MHISSFWSTAWSWGEAMPWVWTARLWVIRQFSGRATCVIVIKEPSVFCTDSSNQRDAPLFRRIRAGAVNYQAYSGVLFKCLVFLTVYVFTTFIYVCILSWDFYVRNSKVSQVWLKAHLQSVWSWTLDTLSVRFTSASPDVRYWYVNVALCTMYY